MSDDKSKYQLKIAISMKKEGDDAAKDDPWKLQNIYNNLDYGDLVIIQSVLVESVGASLTGLGIARAEELGFKVKDALLALKQVSISKTKRA